MSGGQRRAAVQIQGTFIGIGERCGNADLSVIVPNLQLKQGYECINSDLSKLSEAVYAISEICNMPVPLNKPTSASAPSPTRAACTSTASANARGPSSMSNPSPSATSAAS